MSRNTAPPGGSSSSSAPPSGRSYPQDYIVRIRYQNTLPPPPNPPKLLDIPNPAVANYTGTGFASRLAREQPLNIEVDSELGMPLDLVHVPGVFERDESALRPIDPPPPVHPTDRLLLRPANALGKPTRTTTSGASGVSFLRRTEYISNESSRSTFKSTTSASLITNAPLARKVRSIALKAEEESDPVRILAAVMRGFDIANPETVGAGYVAKAGEDKSIKLAEENWRNLKHPTKRGVKPVAMYPVLPDPGATGELSGYLVYKFSTDPLGGHTHVQGGKKVRDERIDVGMMRIRYLAEELRNANLTPSQLAAQSQVQKNVEREGGMTLDFYIPPDPSAESVRAIKRKFSDMNSDDSEETEKHPDGSPPEGFKFQFVRAYDQQFMTTPGDSANSANLGTSGALTQEVAIVLHDEKKSGGEGRKLPTGAYWYPIVLRSLLRPKRNEQVAETFFRPTLGIKAKQERDMEEEGRVDLVTVRVRELVEEERGRVEESRKRLLGVGTGV